MKYFDKIFKKPDSSTPNDLTTITRTETLEGFAIPGIIWNTQYYFTDIQIYRDGVVNCCNKRTGFFVIASSGAKYSTA